MQSRAALPRLLQVFPLLHQLYFVHLVYKLWAVRLGSFACGGLVLESSGSVAWGLES